MFVDFEYSIMLRKFTASAIPSSKRIHLNQETLWIETPDDTAKSAA